MADTIVQNKVTGTGTLRRAMRANGVFSGVSGLLIVGAAGPIARMIGVSPPAIIAGVGVALVGYAAFLFVSTNGQPVDRRYGVTAVAMDVVWVMGSIVLLLTDWVPFTTAGKWAVGLVAEAVFWFAVWQIVALRRQR